MFNRPILLIMYINYSINNNSNNNNNNNNNNPKHFVIQPLYSVRQIWASLEHWRHSVSFSYRHYSDIETKASRLAHPKAPDATVCLVFLWAYKVILITLSHCRYARVCSRTTGRWSILTLTPWDLMLTRATSGLVTTTLTSYS